MAVYYNIDSLGNFIITGNELPHDQRYYRLYVNSDAHTKSSLYSGSKRNYFLLLLDNNSVVTVNCDDVCKINFSYTITNSPENAAIASLQDITNEYNNKYIDKDTLSKQKMALLIARQIEEYRHFADTCRYPLVGLLAISEKRKSNDPEDTDMLTAFSQKLKKELPNSIYTKQFSEELEVAELKEEVKKGKPATLYLVIILLICSLALNAWFLLKKKTKKESPVPVTPENDTDNDEKKIRVLIDSLSIKEREILAMLHAGSSNKEIAASLNVEESTVKTHVSNIYQKLSINSRKEVAAIARHL